jgi:hypothetical protein
MRAMAKLARTLTLTKTVTRRALQSGAAILLAACFAAPASAERRVALVIGNAYYQHTDVLPNTVNDAHMLAAALRRLNFEVLEGMDLNFSQMNNKFKEFSRVLNGADVALFYFSGHGMQVANENYLVPVDAALKHPGDLEFETIKADQALRLMVRHAKIKILLLDACRDNPLANELARSVRQTMRTPAPASGLAQINASTAASGTLIAFAAAPGGAAAFEGRGPHSPFTQALLEHIETPGLDIDLLMKRVRGTAARMTGERQQPWTNSSLNGEFYLRPVVAGGQEALPPLVETPSLAAVSDANGKDDAAAKAEPSISSHTVLEPAPLFPAPAPTKETLAVTAAAPEAAPPAYAPQPYAPGYDLMEMAKEQADKKTEKNLHLPPDGVRDVHVRLRLLGLYKGSPNSKFRKKGRAALRAWQESLGLEPTGYLNLGQAALLAQRTQAARDEWFARGQRFLDDGEQSEEDGGGGADGRKRRRHGGGDGDIGDFFGAAAHGIGNALPF